MDKIIEKILEYVEPDCELNENSLLKSDCGLTSFDTTCLIGDLCAEYGKDAKDIDLRNIKTVGELAAAFGA